MTGISEKTLYETCPICSGSVKHWRVKNTQIDRFPIDLCESCGFAFVNPRPSLAFLTEYYSNSAYRHGDNPSEYQSLDGILAAEKKDPNSTLDAERMIKTVQTLNSNQNNRRFLDVGCGYGFFSKQAISAGFEVTALELAEVERKIAGEMTGLVPAACSFEEFDHPKHSFSVVFMSQILEHALDVNCWIEKAHGLLVDHGILAVALPNFGSLFRKVMQENEPFICPPAHLNFFDPKSLSCLLEKQGFKVEAIQWVSRIPRRAFEKRLPQFAHPVLPLVNRVSELSLKAIDACHLGMIIGVYGRKISAG